jgi:hypothetical protein
VLTIEKWWWVLEELADIRSYDEAKSSSQESSLLDEVAKKLRSGPSS